MLRGSAETAGSSALDPSFILRKYSWICHTDFLVISEAATILEIDSSTAYIDPWYGLHDERYGSKP